MYKKIILGTSRRASICLDPGTSNEPKRGLTDAGKVNVALQKKISSQSEAAVILEGAVPFQDKPLAIFVKMKSALHLSDLPEVDLPTRFFFFFTGPLESNEQDQLYCNIGKDTF